MTTKTPCILLAKYLKKLFHRSAWASRISLLVIETLSQQPRKHRFFQNLAINLQEGIGASIKSNIGKRNTERLEPFQFPKHSLYAQGMAELKLGNLDAAEGFFRAAVMEMSEGLRWPWFGVVESLRRQGRHREAVQQTLAAALNWQGCNGQPAVALPWWLFTGDGVDEQTVTDLREVVRRYPMAEEPLVTLSTVENGLGRTREASQAMLRAAMLHWPDATNKFAGNTSPCLRKKPSFLIIGQPKAGTTALFELLALHDQIDPPLLKEPFYWSTYYAWGEEWYDYIFPPKDHCPRAITFESSVNYFAHPHAARRLAEKAPNMRLILILRDSVDRVFSEYQQYVRSGFEHRSWEEVVDHEISTSGPCPLTPEAMADDVEEYSILLRGAALPHLRRWLKHFALDQLLILQHHDFLHDPMATLQRVYEFVGISWQQELSPKRVNEGFYAPMASTTERRLRSWYANHQLELDEFLKGLMINSSRSH